VCGIRLAENAGPKKVAKNRHLSTIAELRRAISSQLRHVSTIGKNLLCRNISSRCPYNTVNLGPLTAEIDWRVWGTPSYFNGYRVLTALLHGSQIVGVSRQPNFAALYRGRATITLGIGPHSSCSFFGRPVNLLSSSYQ